MFTAQGKLHWLDAAQRAAFAAQETNAFRLADAPGFWIERYGPALLVSGIDAAAPDAILPLIDREVLPFFEPAAIFARRLVSGPQTADRPVMLRGNPSQCRFEARERGVRYGIDFSAGYSCGLFLDQRLNRAKVRRLVPRRMLNLFAYTCSFSVCAALAGGSTTSIDLSKASLARGRENFALNGLPTASHRFLHDDVLDVLPRLARRGERFDVIIVDPPTFSRGRGGKVFRAEEDFPRLLAAALACAAERASILISTNASAVEPSGLERLAREVAPRAGRFEHGARLPDIAPRRAAATLWITLP